MNIPLILVGSDNKREAEIQHFLAGKNLALAHPDVLVLSEKLGIEAIKKVKEHLFLKPTLAQFKAVVINPADSLTVDAQNALLKLLEEPTDTTLLVLGVGKEESLLKTVLSRCEVRVLDIEPGTRVKTQSDVVQVLELDIVPRLEFLEKIEDRKIFLADLLHFYQDKLKTDPQLVEDTKMVLQAEQWMNQNVPAKAITDFLMLKLRKVEKTD